MNKSLRITADLCREYGSCREGIDFIEKYFPDGFTIEDVYKKRVRHISLSFIHDGYRRFPFTERDKEMYLEYVKVDNCLAFDGCYDIKNCQVISDSKYCQNAENIFSSSYIKDSQFILRSGEVIDSKVIFDSTFINRSKNVLTSINVEDSDTIVHSEDIRNSDNIAYSNKITDGKFLIECNNVNNSIFSRKLVNCSNKIFCYDLLDNDELMIFNRPVSEMKFKSTKEIVSNLLKDRQLNCILSEKINFNTWKDRKAAADLPTALPALAIFYHTFKNEPEFWEEVQDLVEGYDREVLYQITFSEGMFN